MKLVVKELRSDSAEVVSSYERSYQGGETVLEFKRRLAEKGVRGYGKDSFGTSCGFHSIYLQKKRVPLKKVLVFFIFRVHAGQGEKHSPLLQGRGGDRG